VFAISCWWASLLRMHRQLEALGYKVTLDSTA
jgi:hypothetical protein